MKKIVDKRDVVWALVGLVSVAVAAILDWYWAALLPIVVFAVGSRYYPSFRVVQNRINAYNYEAGNLLSLGLDDTYVAYTLKTVYFDTRALSAAPLEELEQKIQEHLGEFPYEGALDTPEAVQKIAEKILFWAQIAAKKDDAGKAHKAVWEKYGHPSEATA